MGGVVRIPESVSSAQFCVLSPVNFHKNGKVTYFHQALLPVIVAPDNPNVIALAPEFITPQDGHDKQDCEQQTAKRWIKAHAQQFKDIQVTLLGDDLYSRQPLCELCLEKNVMP